MARTSTAQVVIKGNTADLQKNLKKAEKGMQEFKDMGSNALSSIGDLIGVDTRQIGSMVDSVKKLSSGMQAMGSTGNAAFAGLTRGASLLGAGIASIGIAGLVAGFKELNKQAEIFAQTDFGSDFMNVQQGMRDTYAGAFMQYYQQDAASWMFLTQKQKSNFQRAGRIIGQIFKGGFSDQNIIGAFKADQYAMRMSKAAEPYLQNLEDAKDYMRDQSMVWSQTNTQIRAYLTTAKDTSKTEEERNQALWSAQRLQKKIDDERIAGLKAIYEYSAEINKMSPTPEAGIEDVVAKYNEWQDAISHAEDNMSSFIKLSNRINKSSESTSSGVGSTATEVDHLAEAIADMSTAVANAVEVNKVFGGTLSDEDVAFKTYESSLERIISAYGVEDERIQKLIKDYTTLRNQRMMSAPLEQVSSTPTAQAVSTTTTQTSIVGFKMPELTEEQQRYYNFLQGMVDASEKANEAIRDALVDGISNSIQYLADCFMGLEEFNGAGLLSALLTPLANVAVEMGEILIAQGIGVEACKKALESLNGYAAIAAGVALVTIGAAAKAGLRSAVNHATGGGYSTSVASSAYTSNASNPSSFGREMEVKVTGTLTANGSQLVAVLNNEHNRNSYTT